MFNGILQRNRRIFWNLICFPIIYYSNLIYLLLNCLHLWFSQKKLVLFLFKTFSAPYNTICKLLNFKNSQFILKYSVCKVYVESPEYNIHFTFRWCNNSIVFMIYVCMCVWVNTVTWKMVFRTQLSFEAICWTTVPRTA